MLETPNIRTQEHGKLELHVPEKFTSERPAVAYTHETFDVGVNEHPLGSQIPKPTDGPSIQAPATAFEPFAIGQGAPRTLDDYTHTDHPQLSLHIVSFKDATLVTIIWLHTLSDAMGLRALVSNWSMVLAGREADVQPLKGVHEDPLESIGNGPKPAGEEPWALADKLLTGLSMFGFIVRFLWQIISTPKHQMRSIYLPAKTVDALRTKALRDLTEGDAVERSSRSDIDIQKPFISNGDVLTAWAAKMVCASFGKTSTSPFAAVNMFDLRGRLKSVFDSSAAYMGNIFLPAWGVLKAGDIVSHPLGRIALALRSNIQSQTAEGQIRAIMRTTRETMASANRIPMALGSSSGTMMTCTSWDKANIFEAADFRTAVVKPGDHALRRGYGPGRPVLFYGASITSTPMARNVFNIIGKDGGGNVWIMGVFSPKTWQTIEYELRTMSDRS